MSLRSPTTCSYVSEATSFAMRHCTIAASPLPMSPEPDSVRSRHFIIDQHASGLGNEKKSPCRLWLIDGCKSLFNVKPSTVPTKPIHELYAHTRTTHPERFLDEERARRPNSLRHLRVPRFMRSTVLETLHRRHRLESKFGYTGRMEGRV